MILLRLSLSILLAAIAGTAQSPLTTLFASNNGGSTGGANYFDLRVQGQDLTVFKIDVNSGAAVGTAGTLQVYLIPNSTYVGNMQAGPTAWGGVPAASGNLVSAGPDLPSTCVLNTYITLQANTTYAVALVAGGFPFRYTNGDGTPGVPGSGSNQTYTNPGELQLVAGAANNTPLTSTVFEPRVCNCSIHYLLGTGTPVTAANSRYGGGCYDTSIAYYEEFAPLTFDMGGTPATSTRDFVMTPNGVGGYVIGPGSGLWFGADGTGLNNVEGATPGSPPVSASILNVDEGVATIDLAASNFTHLTDVPGGSGGIETSLTISSNGSLSVDPGLQPDFTPSVFELLDGPQRFAPLWTDLSPNIQGSVHWDVDATTGNGYVTFHDVADFGLPPGTPGNSFQVAFLPNGVIEVRYEQVYQSLPAMVGLSMGNRATDPGPSDIFDAATMQTNTVDLGTVQVPPRLSANTAPVTGTGPIDLILEAISPNALFGAILTSGTQDLAGTDLGFLGMPGCNAHIDPFNNNSLGLLFFGSAQSVRQTFFSTVPTGLSGLTLYLQAGIYVPGSNPANAVVSNGLLLRIGDL